MTVNQINPTPRGPRPLRPLKIPTAPRSRTHLPPISQQPQKPPPSPTENLTKLPTTPIQSILFRENDMEYILFNNNHATQPSPSITPIKLPHEEEDDFTERLSSFIPPLPPAKRHRSSPPAVFPQCVVVYNNREEDVWNLRMRCVFERLLEERGMKLR